MDGARSRRLRLDPGALDFSRRYLYRTVIAVLAFVDRDVVHPHRILFRGGGRVRQSHRIAVVFDLAVDAGDGRRRRPGSVLVEADVGPGGNGAIVATVTRLSRCQ